MKKIILLLSILTLGLPAWAEEHGHGNHAGGHDEGGVVKLTAVQMKQGGIVTIILKSQIQMESIQAPGVVDFNGYGLADITILVDATVYSRHVYLGDRVSKGQALVTLNSTVLAQAEANYLKARAEHHRSKQERKRLQALAKKNIISQARLQQVESTYQSTHANFSAAKATLFSYGLNRQDLKDLLKEEAYGLLTLRAPHIGTVVADDFRLGQHIAAGSRLMQIVDESHVWVEVKIPEARLGDIMVGKKASVLQQVKKQRFIGKVMGIHHELDAVTRTAGVRLIIENTGDILHPGMFVTAEIATASKGVQLLIPKDAVQRQGSELIVFVEEEPGHFERREVSIEKSSMGLVHILTGVKVGEAVVVKGAFVLASELAKAGFEVHNH